MRSILLTLTLFLFCPLFSRAQITITDADLPNPNDTFRVSTASILTPVDLTLTGANYTWDFSGLVSTSQTVDSFINVASTGLIYSLFFSFGANAANLVQRGPDITTVPGFAVTDVYNFYNNSSASYTQVGIGASMNGLPTPVAFGNKDFIYNFPLNFANQDSSDSDYGISLLGLGAYQAYQKRVNNVDGWGTVITPYGTFDALRVVADLTGTDSLYLDTLGMGFMLARNPSREYKWLAAGQGIPVLQINTQFLAGLEQIVSIRYKDSLYTVGINNPSVSYYSAAVYPNPSTEQALLRGNYAGTGNFELLLTDLSGKSMGTCRLTAANLRNGFQLDAQFPFQTEGIYLLHLRGAEGTELIRWVRNR